MKDDLDFAPYERLRFAGRADGGDALAFPREERDFAARRLHRAQNRPAGRRLAAAAFAHERERLANAQVKAHVVHRADRAANPSQKPADYGEVDF